MSRASAAHGEREALSGSKGFAGSSPLPLKDGYEQPCRARRSRITYTGERGWSSADTRHTRGREPSIIVEIASAAAGACIDPRPR